MWLILLIPGVFSEYSNNWTLSSNNGVLNDSNIHTNNVQLEKNNYIENGKIHFSDICKNKKCVRKCCGEGQGMYETECGRTINKEVHYKFYSGKNLDTSYNMSDILFLYNVPCKSSSYIKIMLQGKFYLQTNGSVFGIEPASEDEPKYKMYSRDDYCVENFLTNIVNDVKTWELKVFICVDPTEEVIQVQQSDSIGNLFLFCILV